MNNSLIIIPARFGSSRLPGKPLLSQTGKPLIQHTVESAKLVSNARVVVATDDERILSAVKGFGGEAVMTRANHQSGSDRCAEAALLVGGTPEVIVNVQGDEPEISPVTISALIKTHRAAKVAFVSTAVCRFSDRTKADDPNAVKAVLTQPNEVNVRWALYFSRARVPYPRADEEQPFLHLGLYAFSPETLQMFPKLAATPLERTESLEQMRVLEHGHRVAAVEVADATPGIDTPQDYTDFVQRMQR